VAGDPAVGAVGGAGDGAEHERHGGAGGQHAGDDRGRRAAGVQPAVGVDDVRGAQAVLDGNGVQERLARRRTQSSRRATLKRQKPQSAS
jgi:hypothetical protein